MPGHRRRREAELDEFGFCSTSATSSTTTTTTTKPCMCVAAALRSHRVPLSSGLPVEHNLFGPQSKSNPGPTVDLAIPCFATAAGNTLNVEPLSVEYITEPLASPSTTTAEAALEPEGGAAEKATNVSAPVLPPNRHLLCGQNTGMGCGAENDNEPVAALDAVEVAVAMTMAAANAIASHAVSVCALTMLEVHLVTSRLILATTSAAGAGLRLGQVSYMQRHARISLQLVAKSLPLNCKNEL
jgi:hypothetical protein